MKSHYVLPLHIFFYTFSQILPPLNKKSRFSRSETLKKSEVSIRMADIKFFSISDLEKCVFRFKGGTNRDKYIKDEKSLCSSTTNRLLYIFPDFASFK